MTGKVFFIILCTMAALVFAGCNQLQQQTVRPPVDNIKIARAMNTARKLEAANKKLEHDAREAEILLQKDEPEWTPEREREFQKWLSETP